MSALTDLLNLIKNRDTPANSEDAYEYFLIMDALEELILRLEALENE